MGAWTIDFGVIALYVALLTGVGLALQALRDAPPLRTNSAAEKLLGQGLAFLALTLPVILYFAISEASRRGATIGKRLMGLRVSTTDGRRVTLARSLARSALKFAPWEIAHTAIWQVPGRLFVAEPGPWNLAGYCLGLLLAASYVATLFHGRRRTPYDRVSGTTVVRASQR